MTPRAFPRGGLFVHAGQETPYYSTCGIFIFSHGYIHCPSTELEYLTRDAYAATYEAASAIIDRLVGL